MAIASNMEIISKEIIKPSSSTPDHRKKIELSFIDQISPLFYTPLIFFFDDDKLMSCARKSQLLKQSLADTLTVFYPVAGRVQENSFIDCNDSGVELVEARVHARLSEVIDKALDDMEELKKLQAVEAILGGNGASALLAVQISYFDCGGIAIGVSFSHKIADVPSLVEFINAWAATCRGDAELIVQPRFDMSHFLPPTDISGMGFTNDTYVTKEGVVTKRFVFDAEKIAELKQLAISTRSANGCEVIKDPTRVEVVSAYIWERFIEVARNKNNDKMKMLSAYQSVNIRPRPSPPLPQNTFGNCWWLAIALTSTIETNNRYLDLVAKFRNAIRKINNDYIEQLKNGDYLNETSKSYGPLFSKDVELYQFTSWSRFPFYEVDFGWGRPCRVCTTPMPLKNIAVLMDTPSGDGIEALVNILEEDAESFESLFDM